MLRLLTFGGLHVASDDGSVVSTLRPPRLALLAILAAAGERGVSRERLAGIFWPDSDDAHARHALRQRVYGLRSDLERDVVRSSAARVVLDETAITADVIEFRAALAAGDRAGAMAYIRGPFLDGFYLAGAPEFERWVEEERARLAESATSALLSLAADATRANQSDLAVQWWRQLTVVDPLSGRYALGYLKALAARGDRAKALEFARQHETLVRRELETDPDPDVRRLEAELRAMPSPDVTRKDSLPPAAMDEPNVAPPRVLSVEPSRVRRRAVWYAGAAVVVVLVAAALVLSRAVRGGGEARTLAVGFIREDGVPDSARVGRVLTDMLATNLARIDGLSVLANSRLLEIMQPGLDSSVGYSRAARRAGASELLEGRLLATPHAVLALEMRRVDLGTGIVKDVYRVSALDRYALVDSLTQAIARRFRLSGPPSSVADATTRSPVAYRFYEEGMRAFLQADLKGAQRLMRAALDEDSTFAMAAYYEVMLAGGDVLPDGRHVADARRSALRLAARAPERERLTITANLLKLDGEPRALAVAESLVAKYPNDPRALVTVADSRSSDGDWRGAVDALEGAVVLDSLAESTREPNCRLCQDLGKLVDAYLWWDSLPAVQRTARRMLRVNATAPGPHWVLTVAAARGGDSAAAYAAFRRFRSLGGADPTWKFSVDLMLEDYEALERDVRPYLASSNWSEWANGAWSLLIALRNQGRLGEALQLHRTGQLPGLPPLTVGRTPDDFNEGILALERGDGRASAAVFAKRLRIDMSRWAPGFQSRHLAWNGALQGMGLAAAGDTMALRALADSVERWGRGSSYGRDRRAHHYLRGLVLAAAQHHEDAAREFRESIHSPSLGFTRENYELARCLLTLGRPREAVAALQPALRGAVDASNLYITRTEVHELLAQAFDRANEPDSAAAHYRAVLKAWRRADRSFQARRDAAQDWLAHHAVVGAASQ